MLGCDSKSTSTTPQDAVQTSTQTTPSPAAKNAPQKDLFSVTATPELMSQLKIAPLGTDAVNQTLQVAGQIEVNARKTHRIGTPVTGRVTQVNAFLGQQVRAGEPLAVFTSQELSSAQLAFLKAHSAVQLNKRAVDRAEQLLKADVIGSAELLRRQNELQVAEAEKRAAMEQLQILGMSRGTVNELERTGHLTSNAPVVSTIAGTIIERNVTQGQVVQSSDELFVVSDLSSVWAVADVPEQDAATLAAGQSVNIKVPALGDAMLQGKVSRVSDIVNPETRTIRTVIELDNRERKLKPAMLISVVMESKGAHKTVVPSAAVIRENDRDHLFVVAGERRFKLIPVELGEAHKGQRAVLTTFPEGTQVVVDGAFHLNNQRNKNNIEQ
jgi:cobalt-zinc-cadmium efflux system membrane fusion protein